jgi:hypothetical protein
MGRICRRVFFNRFYAHFTLNLSKALALKCERLWPAARSYCSVLLPPDLPRRCARDEVWSAAIARRAAVDASRSHRPAADAATDTMPRYR